MHCNLTEIEPDFKTKWEDYSSAEKAKLVTNGLTTVVRDICSPANLSYQLRDQTFGEIAEVAESLVKSYGIYLEFNRAKSGSEKDWMYMLRVSIPGGGPLSREQWGILDDIASKYTEAAAYTGTARPSIRLTTRQNVQLHWIRKKDLVDAVQEVARSKFYTLNGCGDNARNTMGCPLSRYSEVFDANSLAQEVGKYFRLPSAAYIEVFQIDKNYLREAGAPESESDSGKCGGGGFSYGPNLLNRKFKIAFSALSYNDETQEFEPDNCVELRTNDIGVAPILDGGKVSRFQVFVGGSQGEKAGHSTFAAMGFPLGVFARDDLLKGLDAIVRVHQEWGDRKNRHWARLKYVIYKMGIDWFADRVRALGVAFSPPIDHFDYGARLMHHGWMRQGRSDLWSFGAFIENGRIIDGPNGKLKSMVRYLVENYSIEILITPNQDLVFGNIPEDLKEKFSEDMAKFGFGLRNGRAYSNLRVLSGACVGRDTCRLTYTDSEKFEPYLIDSLEEKWGWLRESVGVTGCEKQCFRPATKTIGWVGSGLNMYSLKLGGSEDARFQGGPLIDPETGEIFLKTVPRKEVRTVTEALFDYYLSERNPEEARPGGMGYFIRRVGAQGVILRLKKDPRTAKLMTAKPVANPLADEGAKSVCLVNPSLG